MDAVRPLINSAFNGSKISCFAYGQTGSGKTLAYVIPLVQGLAAI